MKKIKTSYLILYVFLMLLPLILTLAALPHLPEEIPAHYGFSGQVDRWGSKYEALIFPVITICFGALMALIAWLAAHQEKSGTNNLRTCVISGLLGACAFQRHEPVLPLHCLCPDRKSERSGFGYLSDYVSSAWTDPSGPGKYHAESPHELPGGPSDKVEYEKRAGLEKMPAVRRHFPDNNRHPDYSRQSAYRRNPLL